MNFFNHGVCKTQRLDYRLWDELKVIDKKEVLIDFIIKHKDEVLPFLKERLPEKQFLSLIEKKVIRNNSAFDFISESLKSALFRAGGSNIMDWGGWHCSESNTLKYSKLTHKRYNDINYYSNKVHLPLGYSVAIPKSIHEDFKTVGKLIHSEIKAKKKGLKILTRVDFIPVNNNEWYLIDTGDTNLTMGITDGLHQFIHGSQGTILETYIKEAIGALLNKNQTLNEIILVAEDNLMLTNQPYEFDILKDSIKRLFNLKCSITTMENVCNRASIDNKSNIGYVRCFGKESAKLQDIDFVDDIKYIDDYKKHSLSKLLKRLSNTFPSSIKIPQILEFKLQDTNPEELSEKILTQAEQKNLDEFILKPSVRCDSMLSPAFLYFRKNPAHKRQLIKMISKLQSEPQIPYILIEENIGTGMVDNKKLEVRFFCIG